MTTPLLSKAQRNKLFLPYEQDTLRFLDFLDRYPEYNEKPSCYLHFPDQGNYFVSLLSRNGEYNPPVEAELRHDLDKVIQTTINQLKEDIILTFVGDTFVACVFRDLKK